MEENSQNPNTSAQNSPPEQKRSIAFKLLVFLIIITSIVLLYLALIYRPDLAGMLLVLEFGILMQFKPIRESILRLNRSMYPSFLIGFMPNIELQEKLLKYLGLVLIILALATTAFFYISEAQSRQKACTQEAKLCPDGSSVGRTGPKCEFAPCPKPEPTIDPTANWKTYTDNKNSFSFRYPSDWTLTSAESDLNEPRIDLQKKQTSLAIYLKPFTPNFPTVIKTETINIGDNPVTFEYYTSMTTNQLSGHSGLLSRGLVFPFFRINFYLDDTNKDSDLEIIKQILSTFRFD